MLALCSLGQRRFLQVYVALSLGGGRSRAAKARAGANTLSFFCLSCFLQLSSALEMLCLAAPTSLPCSAVPPRCLSAGSGSVAPIAGGELRGRALHQLP